MVKLQRHVAHSDIPEKDVGAWVVSLRADIKRIHELRWELANDLAANSSRRHAVGGKDSAETVQIRADADRRLDEFEDDVYEVLDPYIARLREDLVARLAHNHELPADEKTAPNPAEAFADLKRLREAKLRAIEVARHATAVDHPGLRPERRARTGIADALMRWVFIGGLWVWVHVLRRAPFALRKRSAARHHGKLASGNRHKEP